MEKGGNGKGGGILSALRDRLGFVVLDREAPAFKAKDEQPPLLRLFASGGSERLGAHHSVDVVFFIDGEIFDKMRQPLLGKLDNIPRSHGGF